jgi:hypothetical protein
MIPSPPDGFAGTRAAEPSFPAVRDFPPDHMRFVGRKPEVRLRRIEDLKHGTNPAKKAGGQKTSLRWVLEKMHANLRYHLTNHH